MPTVNSSRGKGKTKSASNPTLVSTQSRLEMKYYHAQKKAAEFQSKVPGIVRCGSTMSEFLKQSPQGDS